MRYLIVVGVALIMSLPVCTGAAGEWPDFRGPHGDGHAEASGLPTEWSEQQHVAWKTPITGRGWSSPIVQGSQIWLTTADEDGKRLWAICLERHSGKLVHQIEVFSNAEPEPVNELNSYASPSAVAEPGRVYVHFGTYGTAALDSETGQKAWERRDLKLAHKEGPGASPVLWENTLIVPCDGMDVQYVIGLDKQTGKTIWKTDRSADFSGVNDDFRKAYSTPLVAKLGDRPQVISTGAQMAASYDPQTGKELWRIFYSGFSNVARPVVVGDVVFLNTGYLKPEIWAVRPKSQGTLSDDSVLWRYSRGVPAKPSPIWVDGLLYLISDRGGVLTCVDASNGNEVWTERLGGNFSASPVYADGKLYFCDQEGKTTVVRPGRTYEQLAVNSLDAGCMASPAAIDGALIVRTQTHVYCLQESARARSTRTRNAPSDQE